MFKAIRIVLGIGIGIALLYFLFMAGAMTIAVLFLNHN